MMDLRFHFDNLSKHGVTPDEVEECFSDPQRLVRKIGAIYWLIAKTEPGRLLQIGYRKDDKTNGKDPGQKPYRFLKAIRKSNFMSVSPPRSACLLAKVA